MNNIVEEIKNDLRDIRIYVGRYFPFLVIPLSYIHVVASQRVPTAGVDERGTLAINPEFWRSLSIEEKRFVAMHEALHVVLCHPFRRKGFDPIAYNIAADAKINDLIGESKTTGVTYGRIDVETLNKISNIIGIEVETLKKMSTEEIARELENRSCGECERDLLDGEVDGDIVQEGDPSVTKEKNREKLHDVWKRILSQSRDFAKQAGNAPAGLDRLVEEVLEVKPPWYIIVRMGVRNHEKEDSSFAYLNRRGDEYPGYYGYNYNIWCLIDTSGSISEEELRMFLGIVKYEARRATIYAIPWDGEAYEVLKAENPSEVARKVAPKMKGGGGTVIAPALMKAIKMMNDGDAVIILTDGYIYDEEKEETKALFKRLARKSSFAMLGYTHKLVDAPGFATVRIDFKGSKD